MKRNEARAFFRFLAGVVAFLAWIGMVLLLSHWKEFGFLQVFYLLGSGFLFALAMTWVAAAGRVPELIMSLWVGPAREEKERSSSPESTAVSERSPTPR